MRRRASIVLFRRPPSKLLCTPSWQSYSSHAATGQQPSAEQSSFRKWARAVTIVMPSSASYGGDLVRQPGTAASTKRLCSSLSLSMSLSSLMLDSLSTALPGVVEGTFSEVVEMAGDEQKLYFASSAGTSTSGRGSQSLSFSSTVAEAKTCARRRPTSCQGRTSGIGPNLSSFQSSSSASTSASAAKPAATRRPNCCQASCGASVSGRSSSSLSSAAAEIAAAIL
mmetsp:Transcript_69534/g.226493  ORF Transcript_69534/g.226493 Transcript_69534/m.226493 type:complete len:225 (+) Transcript_69534:291-965(+)